MARRTKEMGIRVYLEYEQSASALGMSSGYRDFPGCRAVVGSGSLSLKIVPINPLLTEKGEDASARAVFQPGAWVWYECLPV